MGLRKFNAGPGLASMFTPESNAAEPGLGQLPQRVGKRVVGIAALID